MKKIIEQIRKSRLTPFEISFLNLYHKINRDGNFYRINGNIIFRYYGVVSKLTWGNNLLYYLDLKEYYDLSNDILNTIKKFNLFPDLNIDRVE